MEIHRLHHRRGTEPVRFQIEMGDLRERMHARIGAPRADNLGIFSRESLYGLFQRLLDRRPVGLTLPAGKTAAVIFDRDPEAGHGSA